MDQLFFSADGRDFKCWVETKKSQDRERWWMVEVGGKTARVMPASSEDTEGAVRREILRWYKSSK